MAINNEHVPTDANRQIAHHLSGVGLPQQMIARRMGIAVGTLLHHYRDDLDRGAAEATEAVARRMFNLCMSEDEKIAMSACSFWLKVRARWRTTDVEQHLTQLNIQNNVVGGQSRTDDEIERFKERWQTIGVDSEVTTE